MWEAIASNRRRSAMLISMMGVLLVLLGFAIGAGVGERMFYIPPGSPGDYVGPLQGGLTGAVVALLIWFFLWLLAIANGDGILLGAAGAQKVTHAEAPQLFNVVEEMKIASGLPGMPDVYIIDDGSPNAFAVGLKPEKCAVAVTSGLIKRLNRDELQGVIAHEIGHIVNRDTRFMTQAAVMLGAIVMISDVFMRTLYYGGHRRSSDSRGPQALMIIAIVLAIIAPIFARLFWFACSRSREYLADATAARLTRYPQGLASALEKIAARDVFQSDLTQNRALAPLYINNPLHVSGMFSTHPPIEERIQILRSMSGDAGYAGYENAFKSVRGGSVIGSRSLSQSDRVAMRPPSEQPEQQLARVHEALGLLNRGAGMLPIACACGLSIKLRPTDPRTEVKCPRCGTRHEVVRA